MALTNKNTQAWRPKAWGPGGKKTVNGGLTRTGNGKLASSGVRPTKGASK